MRLCLFGKGKRIMILKKCKDCGWIGMVKSKTAVYIKIYCGGELCISRSLEDPTKEEKEKYLTDNQHLSN